MSDDERHREPRRGGGGGNGRPPTISLTVAVSIGASLLTGLGAYFGHEVQLRDRIAEVREKYVSKDELKERVEQPLKQMDDRQRTIREEQIKQGQALEDIRRALERNGSVPPARPRRDLPDR